MRKLLLIALLIFGCAGIIEIGEYSDDIPEGEPKKVVEKFISPCIDTLYIELKNKELEDMNDREYQYYLLKDEACMNYNNTQQVIQSQQGAAGTIFWMVYCILAVWWAFG